MFGKVFNDIVDIEENVTMAEIGVIQEITAEIQEKRNNEETVETHPLILQG